MKQIVVINVSNQDLPIPELRQILPAGTIDERYILPYDIAIKYKKFLYPVMVIDPEYEMREPATLGNENKFYSTPISEVPKFDINELKKEKKKKEVKPLTGKKISKKKREQISNNMSIFKRKNVKKQEIDNGQNTNDGANEDLYQDGVGCSDN